jgi:rsbT antagonist protein RsbS
MSQLVSNDNVPRVSMQIVQNCLVLSVQVELYSATLEQLRADLLERIATTGVCRAIIDLSAVEVMDTHAYQAICDSAVMARVMGTKTLISGIRPGVAAALVELGVVDVGLVDTSLNLEDGFRRLAQSAGNKNQGLDEDLDSSDDEGVSAESVDMIDKANAGGDWVQAQVTESNDAVARPVVDCVRHPTQ